MPPCTPQRNLRGHRRRLTWLAVSAAAGVAVLALWGWSRLDWSNPGPVTAPHAMSAQRCADCHVETGHLILTAAERAQRTQEHNALCLKCHDLGAHGRLAHGVTGGQLLELTNKTRPGAAPPPPRHRPGCSRRPTRWRRAGRMNSPAPPATRNITAARPT